MKKILLGSVALIVMSAPVLAADMPVKVKPLPPVWTWTGCYVGLNVGYTAARFEKSNVRQVTLAGAVPLTSPTSISTMTACPAASSSVATGKAG